MTTESPITISTAQFYAYTNAERNERDNFIYFLDFDYRRDLAISEDFAGIALCIVFDTKSINVTDKKGLRRKVSVTLIDATRRLEIATRYTSVYIRKNSLFEVVYIDFPPTIDIQPNHTYKFVVRDEKANETLQEYVIHTFAEKDFGSPSGWYTVESGALLSDNERQLYKSIAICGDNRNYCVRIKLKHNFDNNPPFIMPEVELRLYKDGNIEEMVSRFIEPECIDFLNNIYEIKLPLNISFFHPRDYYAEARCMGYPIGGFAFTTKGPEVEGEWTDEAIAPICLLSLHCVTDRNGLEYKYSDNRIIK